VATFLREFFTASNGTLVSSLTPDIGGTWASALSGAGEALRVQGNRARGDRAFHHANYNDATPDSATQRATFDVTHVGAQSGASAGVILRWDPTEEEGYVARWGSDTWFITLWRAGGLPTLASVGEVIDAGNTVTAVFEVETVGSDVVLSIKRGGSTVVEVTHSDSPITAAGKAGLQARLVGSASLGVHIDNLVCETWARQSLPVFRTGPRFLTSHRRAVH
jgi:hypothetical protein